MVMYSRKPLYIVLFFAVTFSVTGCSGLLMRMYGIKKPKAIDNNTILHYANRYNIPEEDCYALDTGYISYLFKMDTILSKQQIKNHYQPLQVLYYKNRGDLESFHVNCYTSGFPNLQWNRDGIFDTFPPGMQTPPDSILALKSLLKLLQPLPQTKSFMVNQYNYVVVVYWSRYMGRQSKRLIKTVQENKLLARELKVKVLYVNNDNLFAAAHPKGNK